jgi:hypothetical protein
LLEVKAEPASRAVGDRQGVDVPGAVLGNETHPAAHGVGVRRCPDDVHHLGGVVLEMQIGAGRAIHVGQGTHRVVSEGGVEAISAGTGAGAGQTVDEQSLGVVILHRVGGGLALMITGRSSWS